jgi:naphthoate synthase
VVGEKRAREIWFFCRQYDAPQALEWGLVNKVVPPAQLLDEALAWGREAAALSPTALAFLKASFNADSAHIGGQGRIAFTGLESFGKSAEAEEGRRAFVEKRPADFSRFR